MFFEEIDTIKRYFDSYLVSLGKLSILFFASTFCEETRRENSILY